jgi:hypothetical protein
MARLSDLVMIAQVGLAYTWIVGGRGRSYNRTGNGPDRCAGLPAVVVRSVKGRRTAWQQDAGEMQGVFPETGMPWGTHERL